MKTKKFFIACLIVAAFATAGNAGAQVKVKFGVKGSFTMNTLSLSEKAPDFSTTKKMAYTYTPGFSAGMFLDFRLNPTWTVGAELLFSRQGAESTTTIKLPTTSGKYITTITSDYLQVPLLLKIYPWTGFAFELGPQIGYCFGGKLEHSYTDNLEDWGLTTEEKYTRPRQTFQKIEEDGGEWLEGYKHYNRLDVSVTAGINYRFSFGLMVGVRYNYGFFNTLNTLKQKKNGEFYQEELESKNSSIAVSLGYRF